MGSPATALPVSPRPPPPSGPRSVSFIDRRKLSSAARAETACVDLAIDPPAFLSSP